MELFEELKQKIFGKNMIIVFPEATDIRVLGAAIRLKADHLVEPILIGDRAELTELAMTRGYSINHIRTETPETYFKYEDMVKEFVSIRKGKVTEDQARELLKNVNYFGTMLVHMGCADGLVSGAVHSTGDTIRPALQIIKTKPGVSRTSGAFLMIGNRDSERYIFSDCAININPDAQALAEIAVSSAETAKLFDIDPKVAMLSFSTNGSAKSDEVTKVIEATEIAKQLAPTLKIDGEIQFDAAYDAAVGAQKKPNSEIAGQANVFIFPEIQSGNIGYKIAQRLGGFQAIGPILQGLNKPISDLSRGANEEDVYKLSIITAMQALIEKAN